MYAKRIETYRDLAPLSNDERMAQWAVRYFAGGYHRNPECSSANADRTSRVAGPVLDDGRTDRR